jgi:hypothetical protein
VAGQGLQSPPPIYSTAFSRGHFYLFLLGDQIHQADPGVLGPQPILCSREFPKLPVSPHLLCFQEEQQAQVDLVGPGNLQA